MFTSGTCMYYRPPEKRATMKAIMPRKALSSLVLRLLVVAMSTAAFAQYSLTCASEDGRRHYCAADTRAGVSLQQQRSKSPCTQGATWGFDQNGVWVDRGCRADFLVNTPASAGLHDRDWDRDRERDRYHDDSRRGEESMQLTCSSNDGGRQYCESDIQGRATMTRQRSGSPCREGYSWGYDRRGIWVDHGCRADFQLTGRRNSFAGGRAPAYVGSLRCSSDVGNRQDCPVDTRGGVKIVKQISESSCRLGYSWGYDRDSVWVDHGCRAEFQVGTR
jgi:Protein of unknown function (DUF3011)